MLKDINWGSVADWVSGLGSLAAGLIALYLARSSQRIRLKGYVGKRLIVGGGGPTVDLVWIAVTNIGTRATVINNVTIRVGRFKKKRFGVITVVRDAYSVGVPYPLADGQEGHWGIPIGKDKKWFREMCDGFVRDDQDVRTLRFRVHTNHGESLELRPEEDLLNELRAVLAEKAVGADKPAA